MDKRNFFRVFEKYINNLVILTKIVRQVSNTYGKALKC